MYLLLFSVLRITLNKAKIEPTFCRRDSEQYRRQRIFSSAGIKQNDGLKLSWNVLLHWVTNKDVSGAFRYIYPEYEKILVDSGNVDHILNSLYENVSRQSQVTVLCSRCWKGQQLSSKRFGITTFFLLPTSELYWQFVFVFCFLFHVGVNTSYCVERHQICSSAEGSKNNLRCVKADSLWKHMLAFWEGVKSTESG